jgi:Glycopeptide antibiotics resistance protein
MKQQKIISAIFWGMFISYLMLMLGIVFMRMGMNSNSINFIPFKSIAEGINVYDGIRYRLIDDQVWGNVVIFVPAGIYLMVLNKKSSILNALLTIFLISIGIEIIQYAFRIGASDIDDIILNCLGGGLGILIYLLLEKSFKTKEKIKKVITIASLGVGVPILIIVLLLIFVNYI